MLATSAFSLPGCEMTAVKQSDGALMITAHSTAPTANCPRCGERSQRIHSYYTRRPRDLPQGDYAVRLILHVRRFRCLNAICTAQTFAERVPQGCAASRATHDALDHSPAATRARARRRSWGAAWRQAVRAHQ